MAGKHRRLCEWDGCRAYANLRDLDTSQDFCLNCALAMLAAGDDPITRYREFDEADAYTKALRDRTLVEWTFIGHPLTGRGLFGSS